MVENEKYYFHEKDMIKFYSPTGDDAIQFNRHHLRFLFNEIVKVTGFQISPPIILSYTYSMLGLENVKVSFEDLRALDSQSDKLQAKHKGFMSMLADLCTILTVSYEFNDMVEIFGESRAKLNNSVAALLITSVGASIMQTYLQLPQLYPGFTHSTFLSHFPIDRTKFFEFMP